MNTKEIIDKQIKKKLKKDNIDVTCHFRELGIDSLDVVDMVLSLESKLKIQFTDDELMSMKTLEDLYKLCQQKV